MSLTRPLHFTLLIIYLQSTILFRSASSKESFEDLGFCCHQGREKAKFGERCDEISLFSTDYHEAACNQIKALCCHQGVREQMCGAGWTKAKMGKDCPKEGNIDDIRCCEACKLGLAVRSLGKQCSVQGYKLSMLWESAFSSCCDLEVDLKTDESRNMCLMLPGELCQHSCVPYGHYYKCQCRDGFFLMSDGKSCSPILNQGCQQCSHGCEEHMNSTRCTCPQDMVLDADGVKCNPKGRLPSPKWHCPHGYRRDRNHKCVDIDECTSGTHDCNLVDQVCVNMVGSFNCIPKHQPVKCERGYQFSVIHGTCEDLDECALTDDPPCDSNQDCENTIGSFICNCKSGFQRDPITFACADINECQLSTHNCAQTQRCDNTIGSYACVRSINCGTGYTLNAASGKCEDDDECLLTNACKLHGSNYVCRNIPGSFRCVKKVPDCKTHNCHLQESTPIPRVVCPSGYKQHGSTCVDINECTDGTASCRPDQRCINKNGYYLCTDSLNCKEGFMLNAANTQCIDIDECKEGLCSHNCENRWGYFRCHCRQGYHLASDNRTCIDNNECELGRKCQGVCQNTEGSYTCQCPEGYRLGANKHSCEDINECEEPRDDGKWGCQEDNEVCINTSGSYKCTAIVCPTGYVKDSSRKTRCLRQNNICFEHDYACRHQPVQYVYNFISMTSNYTIPRQGFLDLMAVENSWRSTSVNFTLDLLQARAPPGVEAAVMSDFNLNKQDGRAVLQLLKPLFGPQEVQLELKIELYNNVNFLGTNVFSIEIFVSKYPY